MRKPILHVHDHAAKLSRPEHLVHQAIISAIFWRCGSAAHCAHSPSCTSVSRMGHCTITGSQPNATLSCLLLHLDDSDRVSSSRDLLEHACATWAASTTFPPFVHTPASCIPPIFSPPESGGGQHVLNFWLMPRLSPSGISHCTMREGQTAFSCLPVASLIPVAWL